MRILAVAAVASMGLAVACLCPVSAQEMPEYWAVTGVGSNDVLHLRDVPSADSKSLAGIPYNARGLKHLGCRRSEISFQDWVQLSKAQRAAANVEWCRVEYRGKQGWVAGRFLKPDGASAKR